MRRPTGYISLLRMTDPEGKVIPNQELVDKGIIRGQAVPSGWGSDREEVGLGQNLFVDVGRQLMAYAFGARSPISDYTLQSFGCGTGTSPAQVTDVALQNAATFSAGGTTKLIDGVDFPAPYVARVQYTLGANDCNGLLITEWGLFSGNGTLFARSVRLGLSKTASLSPTYLWRIRF